jgi:hypothetical protein
MSTEAR